MKVRAALAILLVASMVAAAAPALASGLERIRLPSGDVLQTHGPDARSHLGGIVPITAPVLPDCVSESTPHFRALYGLPVGASNRSLEARSQIINSLAHAGGMLQDSAHRKVRLRFLCSGGLPRVDTFRGAFEGTSFALAVAAAQAHGYAKPHVKYVIYWDGVHGFACGQGEIRGDSSRSVENRNNRIDGSAGRYAVNYRRCWSGRVALHEMSHNMGAVQRDAPHSTGAWHCWDGADVMCYADGGPTDEQVTVCRIREYDCGDDDYFSGGQPRGYLAGHWDLAWGANRFLNVR